MAVRDRLAALALVLGLLAAIAGWRLVGPWAGLALAMAGMVVAAAVYRVDRPRPDPAAEDLEPVNTLRPAAGPPSRSGRGS